MYTLRTELKRALVSKGFLVGVIGIFVLFLLGSADTLMLGLQGKLMPGMGMEGLQISYHALTSDLLKWAIPILCTLAYSASFTDECNNRFIRFYLYRASFKGYFFSKTAATILSGGGMVVIGVLLGTVLLMAAFPQGMAEQAGELAVTNAVFFSKLPLLFLTSGIWALLGGIAGAASKNKYLAYAIPFIAYYLLVSFQTRYFKPAFLLNPDEWLYYSNISYQTALIFTVILLVLLSLVFSAVMKRRLKDV